MDPNYCDIGLWEDKVIEEASEVIKAICKAKRFGLKNCNPHKPGRSNRQEILSEMLDLEYALAEYKQELSK